MVCCCFFVVLLFLLKGVGKCFGEITHPNNQEKKETANFTRSPDEHPLKMGRRCSWFRAPKGYTA